MLNKLLIKNINSWGKVEYGVPLRVSDNETRTSHRVGLRHIPAVRQQFDRLTWGPEPSLGFDVDRKKAVLDKTYRTSSQVHANFKKMIRPYSMHEQARNSSNVTYMNSVQSMLEGAPIGPRRELTSTYQDSYRGDGILENITSPPLHNVIAPEVSCPENMDRPLIPVGSKGVIRHLDPYVTTNMMQMGRVPGLSAPALGGNAITFWSKPTPKAAKIGIPHICKKENMDKMVRKRPQWTRGALITEMRKKYTEPMKSELTVKLKRAGGIYWEPNPISCKSLNLL